MHVYYIYIYKHIIYHKMLKRTQHYLAHQIQCPPFCTDGRIHDSTSHVGIHCTSYKLISFFFNNENIVCWTWFWFRTETGSAFASSDRFLISCQIISWHSHIFSLCIFLLKYLQKTLAHSKYPNTGKCQQTSPGRIGIR